MEAIYKNRKLPSYYEYIAPNKCCTFISYSSSVGAFFHFRQCPLKMFEFISNVWYIQTLRYAARWSFLNETVSFLVLGPNTWWSQMLCIWRYGWWPEDYVHPVLATLIMLDSVSSWMEILIFFLVFLSHSKCWHSTLIMQWPLPFQLSDHPYHSTLFSPSYW
jgi:hypothetical protein